MFKHCIRDGGPSFYVHYLPFSPPPPTSFMNSPYLLQSENITIPSDEQILFNHLYMRPLWNMLSETLSVLTIESSQSVPNLPPFIKL